MSAMPHLYQRARRWFALQALQTRATQLASAIREIEHRMETDAGEHSALLFELRRVNARLTYAQQHRGSSRGSAW